MAELKAWEKVLATADDSGLAWHSGGGGSAGVGVSVEASSLKTDVSSAGSSS